MLVWRTTFTPVFTFASVTLAPATTALLSSVTMPSTRARLVCAQPDTTNSKNIETRLKRTADLSLISHHLVVAEL